MTWDQGPGLRCPGALVPGITSKDQRSKFQRIHGKKRSMTVYVLTSSGTITTVDYVKDQNIREFFTVNPVWNLYRTKKTFQYISHV